MRFGLKKSPIAVAIMAVVVLALVAMAATATAVSAQSVAGGPSIPSIKPDDLARFKVTVSGRQASGTDFTRIPEADGCTLQIEGSLGEEWLYERDPGVTMEFQKFGHTILLQRAHRAIGDAAFATKGSILRTASGFLNVKNGLSCISYPLPDPICGKFVKAPLDIALTWSGGKLGIRSSSKADQQTNPAEKCGQVPAGGSSFDQLSFEYPHLADQTATLKASKIFGSKHSFEIKLKDHFLEPLGPFGFTTFSERFQSYTTVKFKRL